MMLLINHRIYFFKADRKKLEKERRIVCLLAPIVYQITYLYSKLNGLVEYILISVCIAYIAPCSLRELTISSYI